MGGLSDLLMDEILGNAGWCTMPPLQQNALVQSIHCSNSWLLDFVQGLGQASVLVPVLEQGSGTLVVQA